MQLPVWLVQLGVACEAPWGEISHETRSCRLPLQGWGRLSGNLPEAERAAEGEMNPSAEGSAGVGGLWMPSQGGQPEMVKGSWGPHGTDAL